MTYLPFIVIDGKCRLWKDIIALRREQLAAATVTAKAKQLALFEALHDDRRPASTRTAAGRYLQPGLFEHRVNQFHHAANWPPVADGRH